MSVVTNIVFTFSIMEPNYEKDTYTIYYNIDKINEWLKEKGHVNFGKDLDNISGGDKHLEVPLFAAAFNYFDFDNFVAFIRSLKWREPDLVQIFVKMDDDEKFNLIEPFSPFEIAKDNEK